MINWWYVGANALWISGLALLLAMYSYRSVAARPGAPAEHKTITARQAAYVYRIGVILVSLGLCATSETWVARGIWGGIALVVLIQLIAVVVRAHRRWE